MGDERRCPQCWKFRAFPKAFADEPGGRAFITCRRCRKKYRGWEKRPVSERISTRRPRDGAAGRVRALLFTNRTLNHKLLGIPRSITSAETCPPRCAFFGKGCYAEFHHARHHWNEVGRIGATWEEFCRDVAGLPHGTLWRHNEAGDLPGRGDEIDLYQFKDLVYAAGNTRVFTFTHKPVLGQSVVELRNRVVLGWANRRGFVVNLSADSLEEADELAELGIGPVAVVVASDAPRSLHTPRGRRITICPSQTANLTCLECQLCAIPGRKTIVGFRAHGQGKALVTELVKARRG